MDVTHVRPYVAFVNLLLLLSALLSALTGAVGGAPVPQTAVAVARAAETVVTQAAAVRTVRPIAGLPEMHAVRVMTGVTWALAPVVPLFLGRRRE